jgi:hypothetical protein
MECIIERKAATILQFVQGLRGPLWVAFERRHQRSLAVRTAHAAPRS